MSLENLASQPAQTTSANVNFRCPACAKLFKTSVAAIASSSPHFTCSACATLFTLKFPLLDAETQLTELISPPQPAKYFDASTEEMKNCPHCGVLNPKLFTECKSCLTLMDRVATVSDEEKKLGALPSLVKAWKELLNDYSNITKHMAFVDRCEDLQALPFALKKYKALKESQPHDKLAQDIYQRVMAKTFRKASAVVDSWAWVQKVNWKRVRKLSPFIISGLFIVTGLFNYNLRNMIGIGASMLFLTVGLVILFKGRFQFSDFWD